MVRLFWSKRDTVLRVQLTETQVFILPQTATECFSTSLWRSSQ
jgi:hypothetical protein